MKLIRKNELERICGDMHDEVFMSHDDFLERFINFVKIHGWSFGGGTQDVTD